MRMLFLKLALLFILDINVAAGSSPPDDFLWLEDVHSEKSMAWVREQSKRTLEQFATSDNYKTITRKITAYYEKDDRLNDVFFLGRKIAYLHKDNDHPQGVLRAMSIKESNKKNPAWHDLIDFDDMTRTEGKPRVMGTRECSQTNPDLCLIGISEKGSDAEEYREFNISEGKFVENGFVIPSARTYMAWLDDDTIIFSSSYDGKYVAKTEGSSAIRLWRRGTPIESAKVIFNAEDNLDVFPVQATWNGKSYALIWKNYDFDNAKVYVLEANGKIIKVPMPTDAVAYGLVEDNLIVYLLSDWNTALSNYDAGSVVSIDLKTLKNKNLDTELVFKPNLQQSVIGGHFSKSTFRLSILNNVDPQLLDVSRNESNKAGEKWTLKPLAKPGNDSISVWSTSFFDNLSIVSYSGYLNPHSVYIVNTESNEHRLWQKARPDFDTSKYEFEYFYAKSPDGEMIPYQVVGPKDRDPTKTYPTAMYVYAGFGDVILPSYRPDMALSWLENGGVYVVANVRGGGAYGIRWYKAAAGIKKHVTIDDLATVAKDMFNRKMTTPKQLGVVGGSSGGFAACAALAHYPELFNAVICRSALTDLLRYHKLFYGSIWVSEYGDPENPEHLPILKKLSPLQALSKTKNYPTPLIMNFTNDDRLHPAHGRRFAAKLQNLGFDAYYYEQEEGGHLARTSLKAKVLRRALQYEYFKQRLMPPIQ